MQLRDKQRIAVLSAYALALHGFEAILPMPVPWLRIGLANIITLVSLLLYDFRTALAVTVIRVTLASMFTGTFLGPSFILSLGGGLSSTAAMGLVHAASRNLFGPVGLSLVGSLFHNLAQLFLAWLLFVQRIGPVLIISPVILLIGTITGVVNGLISSLLIRQLTKENADNPADNSEL
ncbi:MAG: heptaprenyl diphosphate synthase [Thermodesulfovibrio sp.]|nr:heptaprenyl diphosphate synthase [Thermodesulfovibrio sp.]